MFQTVAELAEVVHISHSAVHKTCRIQLSLHNLIINVKNQIDNSEHNITENILLYTTGTTSK